VELVLEVLVLVDAVTVLELVEIVELDVLVVELVLLDDVVVVGTSSAYVSTLLRLLDVPEA